MLTHPEIEELARLRRAVYGPTANELEPESLNRLSELEAAARGGDLASDVVSATSDQTQVAVSVEVDDAETGASGNAGRRRRPWEWLIPTMVGVSFAVGVVVGAQPQWLLPTVIPSLHNDAALPLTEEQLQSYYRVSATQQ